MSLSCEARAISVSVGCFCLGLAACAEQAPPTHEDIIKRDLAEILDLHGSACNEVVDYVEHARLDFRVKCGTGVVYRVRVSPEGHVQVGEHRE